MIKRVRDFGKREPSRDAHKVYIVCEGASTEPAYFSFFAGLSSNLQVLVIPPHEGETDPTKLMLHAEEVFFGSSSRYAIDYRHGDTVWFVIDTDQWEDAGKIQPLRRFCQQQNETIPKTYDEVKSYSAWNVAQSNPCFEIWLHYHFYATKPETAAVEQYASFKEFVAQSIVGGFKFDRDQARLKDAIENAEQNFVIDSKGGPSMYSTEMYRLGEEIRGFVKRELDRLRNKL